MADLNAQDMGLPGLSAKFSSKAFDGYTIKYCKADLDEPADMFQLQEIETKSLRGDEIVLLEKDKYTFLEKYFIVLRYMEKTA